MLAWLRAYETTLWWMGALSIVTFVGTLVVIPMLVVRIPADYFTRVTRHDGRCHGQHPVLYWLGLLLKNLLGGIFIVAGVAMLLLPGQGIITILIGISLMNFPGKRTLERRIVQQPTVLRAINWIRAKRNHPPLQVSTSGSPARDSREKTDVV